MKVSFGQCSVPFSNQPWARQLHTFVAEFEA